MKTLGFDFGSGYSTAAVYFDGRWGYLTPGVRGNGIPSVYYCDETGREYFGEDALEYLNGIGVQNTVPVSDLKRNIDRESVEINGKTYDTKRIVKGLIKHVLQKAQNKLDEDYFLLAAQNEKEDTLGYVCTFPVHLLNGKDQILKNMIYSFNAMDDFYIRTAADKQQHLKLLGALQEPYAAGIYYLKETNKENSNVLVYDLGSGTFDVAAVSVSLNGNDVHFAPAVGTAMESEEIGGNDFDLRLEQLIRKKYQENGVDCNEALKGILHQDVINAKHSLSNSAFDHIVFTSQAFDNQKITISRTEFEGATGDLLERTLEITQKVVGICKENNKTIDDIILVGGGSNMPMVKQALKQRFYNEDFSFRVFNPSNAIAAGAAYYAELLAQRQNPDIANVEEGVQASPVSVEIVSNASYGTDILFNDETKCDVLLPKGTPLPYRITAGYVASRENQKTMSIEIFECDERADKAYSPREHIDMEHAHRITNNRTEGSASYILAGRKPKNIKYTLVADEYGILSVYVSQDGGIQNKLSLQYRVNVNGGNEE